MKLLLHPSYLPLKSRTALFAVREPYCCDDLCSEIPTPERFLRKGRDPYSHNTLALAYASS